MEYGNSKDSGDQYGKVSTKYIDNFTEHSRNYHGMPYPGNVQYQIFIHDNTVLLHKTLWMGGNDLKNCVSKDKPQ